MRISTHVETPKAMRTPATALEIEKRERDSMFSVLVREMNGRENSVTYYAISLSASLNRYSSKAPAPEEN